MKPVKCPRCFGNLNPTVRWRGGVPVWVGFTCPSEFCQFHVGGGFQPVAVA